MANTLTLNAHYYQQFDADVTRDVPAESYGGWKQQRLDFPLAHTALVIMHAWDCGTPEQFPGWHRAVEYLPRAAAIARDVFPPLLDAVRQAGMTLYHVIASNHHDKARHTGYQRAVRLSQELGFDRPAAKPVEVDDDVMPELQAFRADHVFVGEHNRADVARGFERLDFDPHAQPRGEEGIAENAEQLAALCQADGINHLVYTGFAINWCLLKSPGGMVDMQRHGLMCSAIQQATTAVENRDTARQQLAKQIALWRVALAFGFVFDADDVVSALRQSR